MSRIDPKPDQGSLIARKPWLLIVAFFIALFIATGWFVYTAIVNQPDTVPLEQS